MSSRVIIPQYSNILADRRYSRLAELLHALNAKWKPNPGQAEAGAQLFVHGKRRIGIECGRKWGKALNILEKIPTIDGVKLLVDVGVGDVIFGPDGMPTRVIAESPVHVPEKCYEITFRDGAKIEASADHRWRVLTASQRQRETEGSVLTTEEIFKRHLYGKNDNHNFYVKVTDPVQWPHRDLAVAPYVLGLWLGDGSKKTGEVWVHDQDIELHDRIRSYGYGLSIQRDGTATIKHLRRELAEIGVLNNKHIPPEYLTASVEQRLDLLKGLMDSDGCAKDQGKVEFCNSNKNLSDGVAFLMRSLGIKTFTKSKVPRIGAVEYSTAYLVSASPHLQVFSLKRKAARLAPFLNNSQRRYRVITSVKPCRPVPMKCLMVDNDSHLFLAGETFIPTHNTEFSLDVMWRLGNMIQNGQIYYFAAEQTAAREIIWAPRRLHEWGPKDYIADENKTEMRLTYTSGTFVKIDGADNFRGRKGFNPDVVICDEGADYPDAFWHAMRPNFASKDAIVIVISTPPWVLESEPGKPVYFIRLMDLWEKNFQDGIKTGKPNPYFYTKQPSHMNEANLPSGFLAQEEEELKALGCEDIWEREYLAQRVVAGGKRLVGTYNPAKHKVPHEWLMEEKIKKNIDILQWLEVVDPSQALFGMLIIAINPYSKEVFFLDEIAERDENETTEHLLWPRIKEKEDAIYPGDDTERFIRVCDEAAKWWIVGCTNDPEIGVSYNATEKATNSIEYGVSLLRSIFRYNIGYVSDRCKWLSYQLVNWRRTELGAIPEKGKDLIDCARYGLHEAGYYLSREEIPKIAAQHPRAQRAALLGDTPEALAEKELNRQFIMDDGLSGFDNLGSSEDDDKTWYLQ